MAEITNHFVHMNYSINESLPEDYLIGQSMDVLKILRSLMNVKHWHEELVVDYLDTGFPNMDYDTDYCNDFYMDCNT